MKRTLFVLATIVFASGILFAAPRSEQQAVEAASEFLTSHSNVLRAPAKDGRLTHSWTATQTNGQPAFYVFNRGENDGYVIVSAEDRTYTILGYGDQGHFDEASMPENMRSWLQGYVRTIEQVAATPESPAVRKALQRKPAEKTKSYTPVAPICSTQWNQGAPYNYKCPTDIDGKKCVTGCVATAAAQVMKAYNYPEHGFGSHSYEWEDRGKNVSTLSADFEATTYEWSKMIDNYQATSATDQQIDAVATLMFHCGVACEMGYTSESSGASGNQMMNALIEHFGYDAGIKTLLLDFMGEKAFVDSIAADLALHHPVYFTGRTINNSGHAFVCDGINADGLVHINWGWGGAYDNYYRVSLLNPEVHGTGGDSGNYAYTENVTAFIGIQPENGGKPEHLLTGSAVQFGALRFSRNDYLNITILTFQNQSSTDWTGKFGIQLYQHKMYLYNTYLVPAENLLPAGYLYPEYYMNVLLSSLPEGEYELVPVFTSNDGNTVSPVLIQGFGEYRAKLTVSGDEITITLPDEPQPEQPTIDPDDYEFTQMEAIYMPGETEEGYRWNIRLATEGFFSNKSDDELCMQFSLNAAYDDSFLGSYFSSDSAIHACLDFTILEGNSKSSSPWTSEKTEFTIVHDNTLEMYLLHYYVEIGQKRHDGVIILPDDWVTVKKYVSEDNYLTIHPDHNLYTALTSTEANYMAFPFQSFIPYTVAGRISRITNTPEQISHYGNCRLYITDEKMEIFASNIRWLDDTEFYNGKEVEENATCVIVGKLDIYEDKPEINQGYFCQYSAPETPVDPIPEDEQAEDFSEDFDLYKMDNQYISYGVVIVDAKKEIEGGKYCAVRLQFFVPEEETSLPVGKYTINSSGAPQTVLAGYDDWYLLGSWAGFIDTDESTLYEKWYIERGSVTVNEDGSISVNATNSYQRSVKSQLLAANTEAVENISGDTPQAYKILRDGQLLIIRNGVVYSLSGAIMND